MAAQMFAAAGSLRATASRSETSSDPYDRHQLFGCKPHLIRLGMRIVHIGSIWPITSIRAHQNYVGLRGVCLVQNEHPFVSTSLASAGPSTQQIVWLGHIAWTTR